ncbi:MAG: large conductance mechanosensitive channel protein MscL [archaeon]|nr:large conductance mechanosensitive channel protein MscL [archaeon]
MKFVKDFLEFIKKYQVVGLAVAFVIGVAATKLITDFVNDIINPFIGLLLGGIDFNAVSFSFGEAQFLAGHLINSIINFVIIALVVFIVVKYVMKGDTSKRL